MENNSLYVNPNSGVISYRTICNSHVTCNEFISYKFKALTSPLYNVIQGLLVKLYTFEVLNCVEIVCTL